MSGLDIDTRSDIYSLGVLLYELLTGMTPFDAKELMRSGLDEMRKIIREREPLRPSSRLTKELETAKSNDSKHSALPSTVSVPHSAIDRDLDWIVMKCLEKDRARRYETANSLALDLKRHLNNEPVEACPPSKVYRFRKFARKHHTAIAIAIAFAAILVAATAVSTWQAIRAMRAEREEAHLLATAEIARADAESQRGQAVTARSAEATLRQEAELREVESRRQAYASDIGLAQLALAENRLGTAQSLLNRHLPQAGQQDLRGWEWRYLWQNAQGDASFRLCQTNGLVCSLSASHDGRWLAVGEAFESGVSVWDLRSRREVARFAGRRCRSVCGVFSELPPCWPTRPFPALRPTGGPRCNCGIQRSRASSPRSHWAARCLGLVFAADGQTLVTATAEPDPRIALWKVPAGAPLASFEKNVGGVDEGIPLAVTPDLTLAAYSSADAIVHVFDLSTGGERWSAPAADENLISLAFSPDGGTLATGAGYRESAIRLWDVCEWKGNQAAGRAPRAELGHCYSHPMANGSFSASSDRTIRVWDLSDTSQTTRPRVLRGHNEHVMRLALLPDGQTLVSGSEDGVVYVWDTGSAEQRRSDSVVYAGILTGQFTPDSRSVVNLNAQGEVKRWRGPDFGQAESEFEVGGEFDRGNAVISTRLPLAGDSPKRRHGRSMGCAYAARSTNVCRQSPSLLWRFFADGTKLVTVGKRHRSDARLGPGERRAVGDLASRDISGPRLSAGGYLARRSLVFDDRGRRYRRFPRHCSRSRRGSASGCKTT